MYYSIELQYTVYTISLYMYCTCDYYTTSILYIACILYLLLLLLQQDWIEFVKLWDIQEMVKLMVYEWGQVVSYQTPLPCQTETRDSSPETG